MRVAPVIMLALGLGIGPDARAEERTPPPTPVQTLDDLALLDEGLWVEAASRRRQPIALAPAAVTVLDATDLTATPAPTVPDRLRYVPGVDVYQNRHGQFDVGLRGYNGIATPRTLALYDGREFGSEELGSVFWIGPIPLSDLRRVEVVKGPASVAYGANAFGGVIALLPYEVDQQWRLRTYGATGNHGFGELDATVAGPLPWHSQLYVKASAGHSQRDDTPQVTGLEPPADPHPRTRQTYAADLRADRAHVLAGYRVGDDLRLELDYTRFDLREWDSVEDLSSGSNLIRVDEHAVGLRLRSPLLELAWLHTENDGFYSNQIAVYEPSRDFRYAQAGFDNREDRLRGQLNLRWRHLHLTVGGEYRRWVSRSNLWARDASYADEGSWEEQQIRNLAGFAELQWEFDPAWSTTLGLRVDDHNQVGTNASPRLAINRRFGHDHFARLAFSSGYRLPTAIELGIEEFFFRTDDQIEAETIDSLDLSWHGSLAGIRIPAGTWYNVADGLLFFRPLEESEMEQAWLDFLAAGDPTRQPGPFFELRNVDNPHRGVGMELQAAVELTADWELELGATWQRYRFDDPIPYRSDGFVDPLSGDTLFAFDDELPRDVNAPPEWKLHLGATWRLGGVFATGILRWVDERVLFSFPNGNVQEEGRLGIQRVPDYAALDLAIGWQHDHGDGRTSSLRLGIMDLLDAGHYETYEATAADLQRDREVAYSSSVGRQATLAVSLSF